jgi:hypothetical protein
MSASTLPRSGLPNPRYVSPTVARLDAEWLRLCRDGNVASRLHRLPLAGYRSLPALLTAAGMDRSVDHDAADHVVAELVRRAPTDPLAARVVLQRILGALVTIAVRRTRSEPAEREPLLDDLVGTAWEIIVTYPIERRAARVAGNLCRDIEYRCCVAPSRRLTDSLRAPLAAAGNLSVDSRGRVDVHAVEQLTELLRDVGAAHLEPGERILLGALLCDEPLQRVAGRLGCAPRTLRWRRERLVERLRDLAAA